MIKKMVTTFFTATAAVQLRKALSLAKPVFENYPHVVPFHLPAVKFSARAHLPAREASRATELFLSR
jgi:hypothetical protein